MTDLNKLRSEFESDLAEHLIERDSNGFYLNDEIQNYWEKHLLKAKIERLKAELEKAKAQAVPDQTINEIQSWVAVQSIQAMELDGEEFVVGANELAEFIEKLVKSESGAEG
ncbi:hypothetical protein [Acinetobacter sp. ABJ_C5_2]|uniref:hypothetical protein n=1 Tax=Acinetobacter sp. ABJ_C5_2 TaxID=3376992 RepID=UPI0037CB10E0